MDQITISITGAGKQVTRSEIPVISTLNNGGVPCFFARTYTQCAVPKHLISMYL